MSNSNPEGNHSQGKLLRASVLGTGIVIFGLLFFADKTNLNNNPNRALSSAASQGTVGQVGDLMETNDLPPLASDATLDKWIAEIDNTEGEAKRSYLDSIVTRLESRKRYAYAAQYAGQLASITRSLPDKLRAGRLNQQASRLDYVSGDSALFNRYSERAIAYLTEVTEADTTQADALYYLGLALVEGSKRPADRMKGVLTVRKVLSVDPDHAEANYTLGIFSIQTQQFDKAEGRFEKVLTLQPDNYTAQYYLAYARIQQNKLAGAKEMLESVLKNSPDPELKRTVRNLINETY